MLLIAAGCSGADGSSDSGAATVAQGSDAATAVATTMSPVVTTIDAATPPSGDVPVGSTVIEVPVTVLPSTPIPGGVAPPPGSGGRSTGPLGAIDLEIDTGAGTVRIGDAEVPASLDPGFPLPDDLDVQLSSETATDLGFSGTTARTIAELTDFYATALTQAGYEITERQVVPGVLAVYSFGGRDVAGQVAISETPGATSSTILVTVGDDTA